MTTRRLRLALASLVLLTLPPASASTPRWSSCRRDGAVRVSDVSVLPDDPRPGDRVYLNITADVPFPITTWSRPSFKASVYYSYSTWVAVWIPVFKSLGPMCGPHGFALCPVPRGASQIIRASFRVPSRAVAGAYRVVFEANQKDAALFCLDLRLRFRDDQARNQPASVSRAA